jgi:hypothetical protein
VSYKTKSTYRPPTPDTVALRPGVVEELVATREVEPGQPGGLADAFARRLIELADREVTE